MSRNYRVHPKHLVRIHRPEIPDVPEIDSTYLEKAKTQIRKLWSLIKEKHYENYSSNEEGEEDDNDPDVDQELVLPNILITPPPSNEIADDRGTR